MNTPTLEQSKAFQAQFEYFNANLFGGKLPNVLLTFERTKRSKGHFWPKRWASGEGAVHEISLNPGLLASRTPEETASTLVHEMCHLWQQEFGRVPRGGYHDMQWATRMLACGLIPSTTGTPEGKMTGTQCPHYIDRDGRFATLFASMPRTFHFPWHHSQPLLVGENATATTASAPNAGTKVQGYVKYSCGCGNLLRAKRGLSIRCNECLETFVES